jgi:hypothetical protein
MAKTGLDKLILEQLNPICTSLYLLYIYELLRQYDGWLTPYFYGVLFRL